MGSVPKGPCHAHFATGRGSPIIHAINEPTALRSLIEAGTQFGSKNYFWYMLGVRLGYDRTDHVLRVENPCLPGTGGHGRDISKHCPLKRKSPTAVASATNNLFAAALLALSAFLSSAAALAAAVCFVRLTLPWRGRVESTRALNPACKTRHGKN
jgi:hypothetical protein